LARGIDYYTGVIFEVLPPEKISLGSIAGGGRYDNLTEIFGLKNMSGIGISFGLDRLFLVLEELDLLPDFSNNSTQIIFLNFGKDFSFDLISLTNSLRENNINCEFFPEPLSVKKQLSYANKNQIPFAVFYGEEEREKKYLTLKDMKSGKQEALTLEKLIEKLKK
jgi:histidyl-tRNA synthetase